MAFCSVDFYFNFFSHNAIVNNGPVAHRSEVTRGNQWFTAVWMQNKTEYLMYKRFHLVLAMWRRPSSKRQSAFVMVSLEHGPA